MNSGPLDSTAPRAASRAFGLSHDAWGRLVLIDDEGTRHVGVEPVRAFPLSDPTRWVSLCDPEGREVLFIESLDDLPAALRSTLEAELEGREFVPVITRIVRSSGGVFPVRWEVETDRGPTWLDLDAEDDLRRVGAHRVLITDARKSRFQIPDTRALDSHSRKVLERYV
jgi:hypothetical protein